MSRLTAAALCAAACLPAALPTAPASSAPLTVTATFASKGVSSTCRATPTCTVSATSTTCFASGVDGATGLPYSGDCLAHVHITFTRPAGAPPHACTDGYGELTYDGPAGAGFSVGVRAPSGAGGTAWTTVPGTSGTAVVTGSGTIAPSCDPNGTTDQVFTGTLEYARP